MSYYPPDRYRAIAGAHYEPIPFERLSGMGWKIGEKFPDSKYAKSIAWQGRRGLLSFSEADCICDELNRQAKATPK